MARKRQSKNKPTRPRKESGRSSNENKPRRKWRHHPAKKEIREPMSLRRRVDPETAKYFAEIELLIQTGRVVESGEAEEDRSTVCGNALEETKGKELELATDPIISRTLQHLLQGCDVLQLCQFLISSLEVLPSMAMSGCGSHVVETALNSLATFLQHGHSLSLIEDTLTKICEAVTVGPVVVNLMSSSYGSHVIRSLLCLCKGVPLESIKEFHTAKSSPSLLSSRLRNNSPSPSSVPNNSHHGLPLVFTNLVRRILHHAKGSIEHLRSDKYSSFVFQTLLRLSAGEDPLLSETIAVILGCQKNDASRGEIAVALTKKNVINFIEDTASSHLLEVIVELSPDPLYKVLIEVFKGLLFESSSHQCGNFVVQALIFSARTVSQIEEIWMELGPMVKELFEYGKSGVMLSLLASCQRFQTHTYECCEAVARAVSSESEYPKCIVPHLLFLETYIKEKSSWVWPVGERMHILGCLMLQTIFKLSSQIIHPYITSITSMEADHIFHTAEDAGGSHVLEAFLSSDASAKQKAKLVSKLRGYFGELSRHAFSSFTIEKCFTVSNIALKEVIAEELLAVQAELSKTKHGPLLLKKLDINGFSAKPEEWKRRQESRKSLYQDFLATFGSGTENPKQSVVATNTSSKHDGRNKRWKSGREDKIGHEAHDIWTCKSGGFPLKKQGGGYSDARKKKNPGKREACISELAALAAKPRLSEGEMEGLFKTMTYSSIGNEKTISSFRNLKRKKL